MGLSDFVMAVSIIIRIFAVERFMRVFFEERRTSKIVFIISCAIYVTVLFSVYFWDLSALSPLSAYAMTVTVRLPILFIITLNYNASMLKRVVASVYGHITIEAITTVIGNLTIHHFLSFGVVSRSVTMSFVSAVLFYFVAIFFYKYFKYVRKTKYDFPAYLSLTLVMAASTITHGFYFTGTISRLTSTLIVTVLLAASTFLVFYLYNALSKAHEEKLKTALHIQEREYYFTQSRLMQESVKKVRAIRHDMNFHLAVIKDFAVDNKVIIDYIDSLIGNIDESEVYSSTGNIAFDSIINFKLKNAAEDNIRMNLSLFVPPVVNIEIADIVIILGNLLDNALSAVAKVEDKIIKLDIEFNKSNLFIKIDNTFDGNVKYAEGEENHIVTLKSGEEHGHGLSNIRKSVEKYNGHINITHDNNVFSVGVLLYVKDV